VALIPEASKSKIFRVLTNWFVAFQWHGDTFDIPQGAVWMAESDGCFNQASQKGKAIGL